MNQGAPGESSRRLALYLTAWALSLAPLCASGALANALGDSSRVALVWLPWIALVGMPGSAQSRRSWPLALALAAPIVGLALWTDLRQELGAARLEATLLGGLACFLFLGEARFLSGASAARESEAETANGPARTYAVLWFLLVPFLPALIAALGWGVLGRMPQDGTLAFLATLSPIAAIWNDVRPLEGDLAREAWSSALFCPSTLACALLWMILWTLHRRRGSQR